jgi:3-hydroxyacyl-[acyl-carrier-protein] dehydratase
MTHIAFNFSVPADHPSLDGHFAGNPIVPGVLLLDEVMHRVASACGREIAGVQRVKFSSALRPAERADTQCVVAGERVSFRVMVSREAASVLVAEGVTLLTGGVRS